MSDRFDWLEAALREGTTPDADRLRAAVQEEFTRPNGFYGSMCCIAAALLDDRALWESSVNQGYYRDDDAYNRQKDSGMDDEDMGDRPSFTVSMQRLWGHVQHALKSAAPALATKVEDRLWAWMSEVRR